MANKQAFISTTWKPGDIRYADLNGDGKIDRGNNRVGDSGDKKSLVIQLPLQFQPQLEWFMERF